MEQNKATPHPEAWRRRRWVMQLVVLAAALLIAPGIAVFMPPKWGVFPSMLTALTQPAAPTEAN